MKKSEKSMELLAPAGSYESMAAAFHAGADAVYMGGPRFGARAYADNPDDDGVKRAIDYTHLRGKRLYLTVNTLLKNSEIGEELYDYIRPLYETGLDAVIIQDFGVFRFLRETFPGLDLHASTQMTVCGPEGAAFLKARGLKRLVLPRELSLEEIRQIYERTGLDLEVFIHGALCYCYSGQCLMSSFLGGRSGNRGRCAQPCRLPYEGGSLLNMRDLCALDQLPSLQAAGAKSLKIEGRMKSPQYTAGVVSVYRKYLDKLEAGETYRVKGEDRQLLFELFNRGDFTDGYFRRHNGAEMINPLGKQTRISLPEEKKKEIEEAYLSPDPVPVSGKVEIEENKEIKLFLNHSENFIEATGAEAQTAAKHPVSEDQVRKQIEKTGDSDFCFRDLKVEIKGSCFIPVSELNAVRRTGLEALKEAMLAAFKREPAVPDDGFRRAGNQCVSLRRDGGDAAAGAEGAREAAAFKAQKPAAPQLNVLVSSRQQLEAVRESGIVSGVYLPADYFPPEELAEEVKKLQEAGRKVWYALPYVFRQEARRLFEKEETLRQLRESGLDGVLLRSLDELSFWQENDLPGCRMADAGLYAWNRISEQFLFEAGAQRITLPLELHEKDYGEGGPFAAAREQVVYGRVPLMVSAQCVQRTKDGCLKAAGRPALTDPQFTVLTDRTGAEMPCESRCRFCMGVIYNAVPLYLGDVARNDCSWRLQFTNESEVETKRILMWFAQALQKGEKPGRPENFAFTRGNYKRGVQ